MNFAWVGGTVYRFVRIEVVTFMIIFCIAGILRGIGRGARPKIQAVELSE
jgi:hypothetical protein